MFYIVQNLNITFTADQMIGNNGAAGRVAIKKAKRKRMINYCKRGNRLCGIIGHKISFYFSAQSFLKFSPLPGLHKSAYRRKMLLDKSIPNHFPIFLSIADFHKPSNLCYKKKLRRPI